MGKADLSRVQRETLLGVMQARFEQNKARHKGQGSV